MAATLSNQPEAGGSMNEGTARKVVLMRAIETADIKREILSDDDRLYASRSARELAQLAGGRQANPRSTLDHFLAPARRPDPQTPCRTHACLFTPSCHRRPLMPHRRRAAAAARFRSPGQGWTASPIRTASTAVGAAAADHRLEPAGLPGPDRLGCWSRRSITGWAGPGLLRRLSRRQGHAAAQAAGAARRRPHPVRGDWGVSCPPS
jgi:hypothetical protein